MGIYGYDIRVVCGGFPLFRETTMWIMEKKMEATI